MMNEEKTLLDEFALAAITIIAHDEYLKPFPSDKSIAKIAYRMADAMMKERKKHMNVFTSDEQEQSLI